MLVCENKVKRCHAQDNFHPEREEERKTQSVKYDTKTESSKTRVRFGVLVCHVTTQIIQRDEYLRICQFFDIHVDIFINIRIDISID